VGPSLLLALSGTTILVLGAALTLPIMSVAGASDLVTVNVWRAVAALRAQHLAPLAALVLVTTAVFPMLELGCLCGLVACATFASTSASASTFAAASASRMVRLVAFLRPWCQLDILCLALLIASRKLTGLYRVHVGPGLPCLGLVLLVDVVVSRLVDSELFWRRISARMAGGRVGQNGRHDG
jgi:paraquat-inducible protein A